MTLPAEFLNLVDAAGAWLLTYLLHSTLLLGLALVACRWLGDKRLALQESLVRVALVGGLITASLQSGLGWQAATGSIPYPSVRPTVAVEAGPTGAVTARERGVRSGELAGELGVARAATVEADRKAPRTTPWLALAVTLWGITGFLLLGRLGLLALRLNARLRGRVELTRGGLYRMFWRLLAVADVDRPTRLTRSTRLEVPIALGVGRREVSLPDRVVDELPAEQQETVLAHELAHLERHDPAWLLAARIVESALFVQPLNRLARRKLQEIAEYRCDDWAAQFTGRPLTLAKCLTNVATWRADRRLSALAPTMAGRRSGLGLRVRRLLDPGYSGLDPRLPGWWRPIAAAALVAVIVAVPGFSTVEQEAPAAPEPPAAVETVDEAPPAPEPPPAPAAPETPVTPLPPGPVLAAPVAETLDSAPALPAPDGPPVPGVEALPAVPALPAPAAPTQDETAPLVAPHGARVPGVDVEPAVAPGPVISVRMVVPEEKVRIETRVAPEVVTRIEARHRVKVSAPVRVEVRHRAESREQEDGGEERDRGQNYDQGDDWDDDWEDELEDELDALEDELDGLLDELDDTIEMELESVLDALEDELDALEDEIEETLEFEIEAFEEELEFDFETFEDELEALEERVEERLESVAWESREERLEREIEAIEDSFDRLEDQLDDELDRIEERLEGRLEHLLEPLYDSELEHRIEAIEDRIDRESDRLEEMAQRMSEEAMARGERISVEERQLLIDEAKRIAAEVRPGAEEIEQLRAELERLAAGARPSEEELESIRQELLESLEALRARATEGLAQEREQLQQLRRKHKIL